MDPIEVDRIIKPLLMPDLRSELRSRGLSPAGELGTLRERLKEDMQRNGNFRISSQVAQAVGGATAANAYQPNNFANSAVPRGEAIGSGNQHGNNYSRPGGQNVGNFLTDKPSSRVLAPPGGGSQIVFGGDVPTQAPARPQAQSYAPPQHPMPQAVNQNQHYAQYTSPPPAQQQYQQQYVSPNAAQQFQPQAIQQPNYGSPQAQNQHYAQYQGGSPQGGPPRGEAIGSGNQHGNNYSRPGGQNVGNFLTDKPSSRVLAPPGGKSQISFY